MSQDKVIPVKVALRARPLIPRETSEGCQQCLEFIPGEPQVVIGTKSFTYDFAFSPNTSQELVYDRAVANLVKGVFKGYNATVLAYGQTGSGKTYTMGSGYNISLEEDEDLAGVIPRVVRQLYRGIQEREESHTFVVRVSFLEIYNEDLHDLLSSNSSKDLAIREDPEGGILIPGLTETVVSSPEDTILCLEHGSTHRTTGATAMNATSSRSHAIFTIMVEQQSREDSNDFMKSKFHLVDLAGSERCKRTQAEGGRFKEGVNINLGLLALGNVISALGDESQKRSHIPYRDSKLTRLLQDSLGGNSHTVMIACVSPSDSNMEETLNTLRYADRARKIKNKPIVNRDPQAAEILRLKGVVQQLQVQLMQNGGVPGKFEGSIDIKALKERIKELEEENHKLSKELESAVDNSTGLCEKIIKTELARDRLKERLRDLRQQAGLTLNITQELEISGELKDKVDAMKDLSRKIQEFPEEEHELSTIEEETKTESSGSSPVPDEFDAKHALCQAKLSKELQELNRLINLKQDLASQLSENDGRLDNMRVEYEKNVKELESQLENLMKEKEQLQAALDSAKAQTNANKISEQRRQRLKELEKELAAKKKELLEKNKIVKMKESTDKQVTKMNTDIQTMKQQRVKLMKQMKEEADNFRKWKQSKEKEVMQLKAKDRKREYEMTKMARNHEKQQGVLKRKAEEAAAANKRLKEVLEKRKAVAAERSKCPENERNRYQLQVKSLLNQDLEIAVSLKEAQHHLQSLMNDRKELTKQLSDLKDKLLNGPPKKKYAWGGAGDTKESSDEDKEEIKKQIRTLEQDLELRNAQIADLQQKIVDAEDGFRSKNLESIVSLGQAKTGMNYLLDQAVIAKCAQSRVACELRHQRNTVEDLTKQTEKMEEELKSVRHIHQEELLAQQRQYEDRILYLLRQLKTKKEDEPLLNSTLDEQTKERLKFQEQEIERLSGLHEELQKKMEECEVLKKELTLAKYQGRKMSLMPTITRADGSPYFTPPNPLLRKKKPKSQRTEAELMLDFDDFSDTDSDDFIADDKNDKDWTKTPLYKTKNQRRKNYGEISKDSDKSSSGPGGGGKFCSCKGNCQTKRCCCRKSLGLCVDGCGCNPDTCVNREGNSENVSQTSSGGLNTTFNVGLDQSGPGSADSTFNANTSVGRATRKALAAMNASQEEKPRRTRKSRESTKRPSASSLYKLESENSEGKAEDEDSDPITDLGQGGLKKKRRLLKQENSSFFPSITDEA
ncbi:chromosome-associated kinesin KIF4-like [Lingula anatina]|uniref:Chromosome-associated kinesin KIF4-like n=1 Tax=Lingula anatina TaxID=7574 RepID=A0A1S3IN85_LINAN|nr:chromosome-associated kinesin KIF4-like [Lingula anatina]|eukprot:XP_013399662.1 chromosome-associated kinesin KIF4-like [Lingula anatina]